MSVTLPEYIAARRKTIESSIAAEKLAGNTFKESAERAALAEITALECRIGCGEIKTELAVLKAHLEIAQREAVAERELAKDRLEMLKAKDTLLQQYDADRKKAEDEMGRCASIGLGLKNRLKAKDAECERLKCRQKLVWRAYCMMAERLSIWLPNSTESIKDMYLDEAKRQPTSGSCESIPITMDNARGDVDKGGEVPMD